MNMRLFLLFLLLLAACAPSTENPQTGSGSVDVPATVDRSGPADICGAPDDVIHADVQNGMRTCRFMQTYAIAFPQELSITHATNNQVSFGRASDTPGTTRSDLTVSYWMRPEELVGVSLEQYARNIIQASGEQAVTLEDISPVTTRGGLVCYKTTWRIGETVTTPIMFCPSHNPLYVAEFTVSDIEDAELLETVVTNLEMLELSEVE